MVTRSSGKGYGDEPGHRGAAAAGEGAGGRAADGV